jgi:multimeric flavodoxin WrbA
MKVVGINGSPRKEGNTALLIQTVFNELNRQRIDTELISLSGQTIRGCTACRAYMEQKNKQCIMTDDFFNVYLEKIWLGY